MYSEKATKLCKIFTLLLSYVVPVKSKVKISQNFVAFSEYMNFNTIIFYHLYLLGLTKYVRTDAMTLQFPIKGDFTLNRFHDVTNVTKSREKVTHVTCGFNPYTNKVVQLSIFQKPLRFNYHVTHSSQITAFSDRIISKVLVTDMTQRSNLGTNTVAVIYFKWQKKLESNK